MCNLMFQRKPIIKDISIKQAREILMREKIVHKDNSARPYIKLSQEEIYAYPEQIGGGS